MAKKKRTGTRSTAGAARRSTKKSTTKASSTSKRSGPAVTDTDSYSHEQTATPLGLDVGIQPCFKTKKPPKSYRYDSSRARSMQWERVITVKAEHGCHTEVL